MSRLKFNRITFKPNIFRVICQIREAGFVNRISESKSNVQSNIRSLKHITPRVGTVAVSKSLKLNSVLSKYYGTSGRSENFHTDIESAMNEQISEELRAAIVYLSMSSYFGRNEVSLPGCEQFFYRMYQEELEHAYTLIKYLNLRGGHVCLRSIQGPDRAEWENVLGALQAALSLEKHVRSKLIQLLEVSTKHSDVATADFITDPYIIDQEKSISELSRLISRYTLMDPTNGLSTYLFDSEMNKSNGSVDFAPGDKK